MARAAPIPARVPAEDATLEAAAARKAAADARAWRAAADARAWLGRFRVSGRRDMAPRAVVGARNGAPTSPYQAFIPFRCPPPGGSRRSDQPGPQEAGGTLTASSR